MLDNLNAIYRHDSHSVLETLRGYPDQAEHALEVGAAHPVPVGWPFCDYLPNAVVIVGFGASAIAAQCLATVLAPKIETPVIVAPDAELPRFVQANTLVVILSYSGETSDAILSYDAVKGTGAQVLVVTSGGALHAKCADGERVELRRGMRPEYALPSLFFAALAALTALNLAGDSVDDAHYAVALMRRQLTAFVPETLEAQNPAKALASALTGKLPVIYAGSPRLQPIAERWRTQINACAKLAAHSNGYPELTHNELMSWRNANKQSEQWAVLILRDRVTTGAAEARVSAAADLIPGNIPLHELYVEGDSVLARLWTGLYFADWCAAYLAVSWGEDPAAV